MIRARHLAFATAAVIGCAGDAAEAQPLSSEETRALRAEVAALKAQLAAMERRLDQVEPVVSAAPVAPPTVVVAASPATTTAWKGSPQFTSADRTFKAKGRIQADVGYVAAPGGLNDRGLGFSSEMRRIRLGGEGALGGGVGYKLEVELSDNAVDLVDTFVTYTRGPWLFTTGVHNQFQSLDELTGDTTGSFMERAAFTDAFNFERRLGVSAQYRHKDWLFQTGAFTDDVTALANSSDGPAGGDENNSFSLDQRIVYAPKVAQVQLHLGGSAHLRELKRLADAPSRYRQRPYLHGSNSRILATPALSVEREVNYGGEFAAIAGPWHAAAEASWMRAARPGQTDVTFFGGYAELGYFLTGETRTYKDGIFNRTTPRSDLRDGGLGSVQVNLRYDRLDLDDADVRGGTQDAYLAALIWSPLDYLRFNLNYGLIDYTGAALRAGPRDSYRVRIGGARIELDF